jgi:hypothetical protein
LLFARHPGKTFGRHAVAAPQVAPIRQGYPQVRRDAPELVDEPTDVRAYADAEGKPVKLAHWSNLAFPRRIRAQPTTLDRA